MVFLREMKWSLRGKGPICIPPPRQHLCVRRDDFVCGREKKKTEKTSFLHFVSFCKKRIYFFKKNMNKFYCCVSEQGYFSSLFWGLGKKVIWHCCTWNLEMAAYARSQAKVLYPVFPRAPLLLPRMYLSTIFKCNLMYSLFLLASLPCFRQVC